MKKIIIEMKIHVVDFDKKLKKILLKKIQDTIYTKNKNIEIRLLKSEQYWKFPEETQCYFEIYANEEIPVKDFIKYFDVTFSYGKNKEIHDDAIWANNVDSGVFLHKNVSWAHICKYE